MSFHESITNLTNVSLSITKHLLSCDEKNVVFSPLSLHVVLSVLVAGSEGVTQRELLAFLQSKSIEQVNDLVSHLVFDVLSDAAPKGGPRLSVANGLWIQQSISLNPSFKKILGASYKATLAFVDFRNKLEEAVKKVNLWAANETNGLIEVLLSCNSVSNTTQAIFTNALYFKGVWDVKFDVSISKPYDFHLLNDNPVKVPFMTSTNNQYISAIDDFKVLRLPYEQGKDKRQFSMYYFLPNAKDGLSSLIEKVSSESTFLESILPIEKVEVGEFRIPKFKISSTLEVSKVLKEQGLVSPFTNGGLTKMLDSNNIVVSNIFQKSFIEVNEGGTEAAAVTVCFFGGCSRYYQKPIKINFVADHPFLFMIREDLSRTILFVGKVINPLDGHNFGCDSPIEACEYALES